MENNTNKTLLNALKSLPQRYETLNHYRDSCLSLQAVLYAVASPTLSNEPKATPQPGATASRIAVYLDLKDKYNALRAEISQDIERVERVLSELKPQPAQVLRCRYVLDLSWPDVAARVGVSVSHCYKIHRDALKVYEQHTQAQQNTVRAYVKME